MANALLATTVLCLAGLFWLMQVCTFLIPYRAVLVQQYGWTFACWGAVAFLNVFAACYALGRALFLKDTGQKLAHLEKQWHSGTRVSEELARRLEE